MTKERYQTTMNFVYNKAKEFNISYDTLYWNLDGVISCAAHDEEIHINDLVFLMTYRNAILEDCEK